MAANESYTKHLDAWIPGRDSGDPIGCIATSFTFDSLFFEEECLGRFVNIQSNPDTDGPVYLIELEEKLSGLQCAAVIVDQHHCQGARNIRWDLLPARTPPGGVLHAKIALLYWSQEIRLVISSANITEPGYRENQEIFGIINYRPGMSAPVSTLNNICEFIRKILSVTIKTEQNPAINRINDFINNILNTVDKWNVKNDVKDTIHLDSILISPGGKNLFEQLKSHWNNSCNGVPSRAIRTSPFYNLPDDNQNDPSRLIWGVLNKRGRAAIIYNARSEKTEDTKIIKAPETLISNSPLYRKDISAGVRIIDEFIRNHDQETIRPFHLKTIWLENNEWVLYLIGSSNFTSSGTGLKGTNNFEANLLYILSKRRNPTVFKHLQKSLLSGRKCEPPFQFLEETEINTDEEGQDELVPLPECFEKLLLKIDDGNYFLEMYFTPPLPAGFQIYHDESNILYSETIWERHRKPKMDSIAWNFDLLPSGVLVRWENSNGYAYWPILVDDQKILPPTEDLKDLPLEILIRIITSARPLHQVMRSWLKRKEKGEIEEYEQLIDPHKRVDTSSFLLQRTRRVSNLLTAFRQRLERPVYTEEALHWRLYGAIGVKAIAEAIVRDGQSEEEKAFLLSELSLELSRLNYHGTNTSIPEGLVYKEIRAIIKEYESQFKKSKKNINPYMRNYINNSYKVALK